jgi:hypothetical protein
MYSEPGIRDPWVVVGCRYMVTSIIPHGVTYVSEREQRFPSLRVAWSISAPFPADDSKISFEEKDYSSSILKMTFANGSGHCHSSKISKRPSPLLFLIMAPVIGCKGLLKAKIQTLSPGGIFNFAFLM